MTMMFGSQSRKHASVSLFLFERIVKDFTRVSSTNCARVVEMSTTLALRRNLVFIR